MKRLILGTFFGIMFFFSQAQNSNTISIHYAPLDKGEANPIKDYPLKQYDGKFKRGHDIEVIPEFTFQTIEGIGGAFNEIGGEALLSLASKQQKTVMENLFGSENAGFTFCRTAIGSSDFGIDAYSYSEVPEDYDMDHFSIERDEKYVIPYIQSAVAVNPDLKVFGSPWSPPAWMKENGKMAGVDYEHSKLRSDKKVYQAYAKYFAKYIQAYQENGIDISRICVQNETDISTTYPNCIMPVSQLLELSLGYIKPEFHKEKIKTEVYAGTFRVAGNLEMFKYLTLDKANELDGVGVQYTGAKYIAEAQYKFPDMKFMHTEGKCFNGENLPKQAESRLGEISSYINSNCTNYCYWNMILNETTESGWDWKQNSLVNIDRNNGTVQYNPDYNVMFLVGRFIKPGDIRVASAASNNPVITVKDKNGSLKVIIQNTSESEEGYRIRMNGEERTFMLPARAISAIVVE